MALGRILSYRFSDDAKTSIGVLTLSGTDDVNFDVKGTGPACATFAVTQALFLKTALGEILHQDMNDGVLDTKKEITDTQYITLDEDALTVTLKGPGPDSATFNYDACEGLIMGLGVMFGV